MKLNKLIIPVACILLAGNASMAQVIMPWKTGQRQTAIRLRKAKRPPQRANSTSKKS